MQYQSWNYNFLFPLMLLPQITWNKNTLTGSTNCKKTTRHHANLSLCAKSRKTKGAKSKNGQKPEFEQFFDDVEVKYLQFFLENRFHSNWRLYLVLTSGQKPNKLLEPLLRKLSKGLFWANMDLWIKNFNPALWLFYLYSPWTLCEKSEKSLEPLLRKLRYQPTNQLLPTTLILYRGPGSRWSKYKS